MVSATSGQHAQVRDTATEDSSAVGWILFAAVMLGFAGIWNILEGALALGQSKVFTANATYVFSDLRTWGFIILALGALQLAIVASLVSGGAFGRWGGIAVASLSAMGQLLFVHAVPFWTLTVFTLDVLIIYGLAAHGKAAAAEFE